jgi:hypothetical protein
VQLASKPVGRASLLRGSAMLFLLLSSSQRETLLLGLVDFLPLEFFSQFLVFIVLPDFSTTKIAGHSCSTKKAGEA